LKVSDNVRHRLEKTLDLGVFGELFFVLFEHLWWLLLLRGAKDVSWSSLGCPRWRL